MLRALGTEPKVDVDADDVGLLEGDRLLLCSDGLTDMVTEDQITGDPRTRTVGAPQDAADRLVRAANRAGGIDNITAIVLDVEAGEPEAGTVAPSARSATESTAPHGGPWRAIGVVLATIVLLMVALHRVPLLRRPAVVRRA